MSDQSDQQGRRERAGGGEAKALRRKPHPLVLLFTGHGKGKTTAALGVTMRAWGRGWSICWLQFIKPTTANFGETRAAARMGVEMIPLGDGFTWQSPDLEKSKALAHECWATARSKLESAQYDLVVLDEITYPITYGWLDVAEVVETIKRRPANVHVILTGRDAAPELQEFADLVTDMGEVKHPFHQGIRAQAGIEF